MKWIAGLLLVAAAHAGTMPEGLLGAPGSGLAPNVLLAWSVTARDAGAAYAGGYDPAMHYAGYFDPGLCYRYADHFAPAGVGSACPGAFSGNLLNWATMTPLDLLQMEISGGMRSTDTASATVLQRVMLPADFPVRETKQGTPFDAATIAVYNCHERVVFSKSGKARSCDAARRASGKLGDYLVRTAVCSGQDTRAFCQSYAQGRKPEGALQRQAAAVRLGVMSYAAGNGRNVYGGVLRAPLAAARAEWDARTGILSGPTVRALQQAGRDGAYAAADPAAELHYEGLRYLQGRPPSEADGATRADPVAAACQRNAIVLVGHAESVEDRYLPGNTRTSHLDRARAVDNFAPAPLDIMAATRRAGDAAGMSGLDQRDVGPDGAGSYYLAGIAAWARENPIRRDFAVKVETYAIQVPGRAPDAASALALANRTPLASLDAAIGAAAQGAGMVAGLSAAGDGYLLRASYDLAAGAGRLERFGVSVRDGAVQVRPRAQWEAGALLPPAGQRKIFTLLGGRTVPFTADALRGRLDPVLVNYLRGDRRGEESGMRRRESLLGDIVHSGPLIVGAPSPGIAAPGYAAFYARYAGRTPVAYVGANDAMLHAFDAAAGQELSAYLPAALLASVAGLARPSYVHRPWVDGPLAAGEVRIGSGWRSALVAAMGMGARGVFALDISSPDSLTALWEFTEHDDPNMGNVLAPPVLARVNGRDFALIAGGDSLFMLAMDKPPEAAWKRGANYFRISAGDARLAQAAIVRGADGNSTLAYAGDWDGALWRFDLVARKASILYQARDAVGAAQPITAAPALVFAPGQGYIVLFGTGKFVEEEDLATRAPQSLYAVRDGGAQVGGRRVLAPRALLGADGGYRIEGKDFSYADKDARQGWYVDFPLAEKDGERAVTSPMVMSTSVIVQTTTPSLDPCAAPDARTYVLDTLTGLASTPPAAEGPAFLMGVQKKAAALTPPLLMQMSARFGEPTATGGSLLTRSVALVQPSNGALASPPIEIKLPVHRLSWREIPNWQELHEAAIRERQP